MRKIHIFMNVLLLLFSRLMSSVKNSSFVFRNKRISFVFFCSFVADGIILSEMYRIRRNYTRKDRIRVSLGTWNINGDKNPALEHEYPSILDAWILDGPENLSSRTRKPNSIETIGSIRSFSKF